MSKVINRRDACSEVHLLVLCELFRLKWCGIRKDLECEILQQETLETQIALEKQRYTRQVAELTAQQDIIYNNDEIVGWVLAIGMLPAYFFIEGDGEIASELKLAKGTMEALQQVSVEKNCGM